ncbi:MAG TPA: hypothetical protein ENH62_17390 [Marinobacter sp.]|uniref:Uncharacterized protein n=2 Tax=root TaxID=1 RepID=A0A831R4R8_9GAMM|nr:hypothetical protein [Marinobacter antarcticus]HDZ40018.1 hypothetical protein [Marinobacter sp.]HEA52300.1 hypothetical protein [Marinobacter antarcticus]
MAREIDQLEVVYLADLQQRNFIDINKFLRDHQKQGRDIWCRIPDHLQVYLRKHSFGMRGEDLGPEYSLLSKDHRYLSVGSMVVREVLATGQSVVSKTELVLFIDSDLGFKILDRETADFERMKKEIAEKYNTIGFTRSSAGRVGRTQELFVVGVPTRNNNDGLVSNQVMEQGYSIRLSDLFVLRTDYQQYVSESQAIDPALFIDEWMPEDLRLLNRYAVACNKEHEESSQASVNDEDQTLATDLARDLNAKNVDASKVIAALKIVQGKRVYYPKAPIEQIEGEDKVSLLDIANTLAKSHWKGCVKTTQDVYKTNVEDFERNVDEILKDHGVKKSAALSRELSRFIRFRRN